MNASRHRGRISEVKAGRRIKHINLAGVAEN